jgi:hypothetical protein
MQTPEWKIWKVKKVLFVAKENEREPEVFMASWSKRQGQAPAHL